MYKPKADKGKFTKTNILLIVSNSEIPYWEPLTGRVSWDIWYLVSELG